MSCYPSGVSTFCSTGSMHLRAPRRNLSSTSLDLFATEEDENELFFEENDLQSSSSLSRLVAILDEALLIVADDWTWYCITASRSVLFIHTRPIICNEGRLLVLRQWLQAKKNSSLKFGIIWLLFSKHKKLLSLSTTIGFFSRITSNCLPSCIAIFWNSFCWCDDAGSNLLLRVHTSNIFY